MKKLWLVGAGEMAQEYAKVLKALSIQVEVIGRSIESANKFYRKTGIAVHTGGIYNVLKAQTAPNVAIVAVGVEQLAETTTALIKSGTRKILLEKPGGIDIQQIQKLNEIAIEYDAKVWIAYNRRYYSSVLKAKELLDIDGGAVSLQFEFTEWSHVIQKLQLEAKVKEHWLLANSTHVIDLAFHLCGCPKEWKGWIGGSLGWHPASSRFCGAGVTDQGVLFSYHADWDAPGRWGIEVLTRKSRLIFRPMEKLHCTPLGSVNIEQVELEDELDCDFKPGLYKQVESFLLEQSPLLCTLKEQLHQAGIYSKIAGYY